MRIYNYIDASDFAEWVSSNFDTEPSGDIYDKLLEDDYIEGSLGLTYSYQDIFDGIDQEKQDWFNKFFEEFEILDVQLKYG
jgi:hypothetical protein